MANEPEGLDQFLASDPSDMDPQSAVASQGLNTLAKMAEPVVKQATDFHGNLKRADDMVGAAAAGIKQGNYEPMRPMADSSLGMAMGTVKAPEGKKLPKGYTISHEENGNAIEVFTKDKSGKVVGSVNVYPTEDMSSLTGNNLSVQPAHQRKGIATAMYDYAEKTMDRPFQPEVEEGRVRTPDGEAFWENRAKRSATETTPNALPMDEASRAARAADMGFDTSKTYYHGTHSQPFEEFDINHKDKTGHAPRGLIFVSEDPEVANKWAIQGGKPNPPSVLPVHTSVKNTFDAENPEHFKFLKDNGIRLPEPSKKYGPYDNWMLLEKPEVMDVIKKAGFDSMLVRENNKKNLGIFDPSHIRSKFAEFDPAKAKSDKLSYADGGEVDSISTSQAAPQDTAPAGLDEFLSGSQPSIDRQPAAGVPAGLDNFIAPEMKEQKYGTPEQMAQTFAEALPQGVVGPLAPLAQRAAGMNPEDIRGRAEANPLTHMAGQATGLVASMLTGVGEGAIAARLGAAGVAKLAGKAALEAAPSILSRLGSAGVKAAIENMAVASSDEATKMVLGQPGQTASSALVDIGLAGVIGGGLGAAGSGIGALWKSQMGSRTGGILKAISDKAGGIDGVTPDVIHDTIETSGMTIAPEVKAALGSDPAIQHMFSTLQESGTGSGLKAQTALKTFKTDLGNHVVTALGKTPEDVASLSEMSDYEAGANVKKSLSDAVKGNMDPISDSYEKIKEKFKSAELTQSDVGDLATKIAEMSQNEGFHLSPSSPQARVIARVIDELPNVKTLEDLRKYTSVVGDTTNNPELWRVGSQLRKILRDAEETTLDKTLGEKAPELVAEHAAARGAYKAAMDTIENLNDRLHVGRYAGPKSFLKALSEMEPETVLRRLSPKGDAGIIGELSIKFPQVAEQIKDYHLSQVLKNAANRAGPDEVINPRVLFTSLSKMSPEMRSFIMPGEAAPKMQAMESLLDALPSKMNNSGTAKTLDSLMGHVPGSAIGLLTAASGHGAAGFLIAPLAKALGRDIPDAIRLATLKFLGSNQPIETTGFKAMADYIHSALKGDSMLSKASKALFTAGREVIPQMTYPTEAQRNKLDKALKNYQQDPTKLVNVSKIPGSYMPDHGSALSQTAMQAVNYLNGLRPKPLQQNPLDTKMPASPMEKAAYNKALDIAQQPLIIFDKIKSGSLVPKDVEAIRIMYPDLYKSMSAKLNDQIINAVHKGIVIPYKTKMALSLFLGTHLDSTLDAQSLMAAQSVGQGTQGGDQQAAGQGSAAPSAKHTTTGLTKFAKSYQTSSQSSEANRMKH